MPDPSLESPRNDLLEMSITRALERGPAVAIPADFAARIAGRLPPLVMAGVTPRHHGRNAAIASLLALVIVVLVLAHRAVSPSPWMAVVEWGFCAQFVAIAVWLGAHFGHAPAS